MDYIVVAGWYGSVKKVYGEVENILKKQYSCIHQVMAKNDPKWEHLVDFEQIISKNFINERLHGLHSCGWVVWLCQISIWRG